MHIFQPSPVAPIALFDAARHALDCGALKETNISLSLSLSLSLYIYIYTHILSLSLSIYIYIYIYIYRLARKDKIAFRMRSRRLGCRVRQSLERRAQTGSNIKQWIGSNRLKHQTSNRLKHLGAWIQGSGSNIKQWFDLGVSLRLCSTA